MDLELLARFVLALEALACLYLAVLAWREADFLRPLTRALGASLGCGAAAIILYGLLA